VSFVKWLNRTAICAAGAAWHYIAREGSVAGAGRQGRRQGDADGVEREAGGGARGAADEEAPAVVDDLGLGQGVEVGANLGP
jgi:hypothetical protein